MYCEYQLGAISILVKSGNPSLRVFCHLYFYVKILYHHRVMWLEERARLKILLSGEFKGTPASKISVRMAEKQQININYRMLQLSTCRLLHYSGCRLRTKSGISILENSRNGCVHNWQQNVLDDLACSCVKMSGSQRLPGRSGINIKTYCILSKMVKHT